MRFLKETSKPIVRDNCCLLVLWAITIISITSCAHVIRSPPAATPALAPVLETTIFVQSDEHPGFEYAAFDVPEAGDAILRVVNAAKVGASPHQRIEDAEITLNGRVIVDPKAFDKNTDVLKLRIPLLRGANRLGVKLAAKTGQRLSVRIDAPADTIHLEPVADTLVIGESLQVKATLTGLGRPVRDAQIVFRTGGLGEIAQRSSSTGAGGVARTTLTGFERAGTGTITASMIDGKPVLLDAVPVQVFETRSIVLEQSISRTRVAADSERPVSFFLKFLKDDAKAYHITFETIAPGGGVDVQTAGVPPRGFPAKGPSSFVVRETIKGRLPGTYTVTSRATVKETGETASSRIAVKVTEPQPAERLVLGPPQFVPAAITVATPTPVRFAVSVSGVSKPPPFLELQEFDPQSGWVPVSRLLDDGLNGDMIAGNRVYARRITVTGAQEGDRRYRVVGSHDGKPFVSGTRALEVSRFFVGPDPRPPVFVKDATTGLKFVAERVIVSILPSVSAARIEEIVELATRNVTGQAGRVGGYTRQINVFRVELVVAPNATEAVRATAVKAAVAEFETYDEVRYAHPNFLIEFAQIAPDGDGSGACSAAGQWGAWQIDAPKAWALPGGSGSGGTKTVAVLDSGVKHDHPDLTGKVTGNPADLGDVSEKPGGHGTKVAGIIAARHDGGVGVGISGIAHGLPVPIWSFKVGGSFSDSEAVRDKIFEAADTPDVWIINISTESFGIDLDDWECALQYATYPGTPVGSACTGTSRAGSNGKGKLVVVAAGNSGRDIDASPKQYPCSYDLDGMLCVANTDASDQIHPTSNYGGETAGMDLTAPGTDICTTNKNDGYGHSGADYTGTSMAAPHVAGAAAVLWSMHPGWTAVDVANRLKETADPIDSVNPAAYADKLGSGRLNLHAAVRKPDRLVIVLDKSGSMAWSSNPIKSGCGVHAPPPAGCEPSRWEVLNDAVSQMLAVAEPHALPDDRFAVALFDTSVDSSVNPSNRLDFTNFDLAGISNFISNPARDPGGGTSIGAGVTEFETELTGLDASGFHQTILLFTDGDQNHQPYLVADGAQVLINPTTNSAMGPGTYEFAPGLVDICPFALRSDDLSGTFGTTYLQGIADQRCGGLMNSAVMIEPTYPGLEAFMIQVMNRSLIGDKLELAHVTSGQIKRGEHSSVSEKFMISRKDAAFSVLVNWAEPGNRLKSVVLSKDGVDFPAIDGSNQINTTNGDTYMAITLRQPYCRPDGKCVKSEGEWTLRMKPFFETTSTFTYNFYLNVDNAILASAFRVMQPQPGVGHPLRLTALLTEAGKPIKGLPAGSVRAVLLRPRASLGEVLSKAEVQPVRRPDADPISAAGLKASAMLADPGLRASILDALEPGVEKEIILMESAPGLYAASYHDTRVSGIYSVRFLVEGKSADNGNFTRTFSTARHVAVMTDADATMQTIKVSPITPCRLAGGCYSITLKPMDAAGNLLGPGKASLFKVTNFPGRILNSISDQLDGRYAIGIGYPEPGAENPVIEVQGAKITVELSKR